VIFYVKVHNEAYLLPILFQLMTTYLYRELGMPAVYGALIILAVVPFQSKSVLFLFIYCIPNCKIEVSFNLDPDGCNKLDELFKDRRSQP
jgi:hypothetical protein